MNRFGVFENFRQAKSIGLASSKISDGPNQSVWSPGKISDRPNQSVWSPGRISDSPNRFSPGFAICQKKMPAWNLED